MARNDEQTELESRDDTINMRRSFSWNRDFFTSDGFLDADELSNMIEGGGDDDVDHELQKIEEIENLEAILFQEIEASTQKATEISGKKKPVKTKSTAPSSSSSPVKTEPLAKSPLSCGDSGGKKVQSPARRSTGSKLNITKGDSPSKTSVGMTTKNKVVPVNTRVSRTMTASPESTGSSSSSMFSVKQRPKRSSSAPRRSSINNEKPSAISARKNEKTTVNKVGQGPVSTRVSRTPTTSPGSSSSTVSVSQRSNRSSSAPRRSSINNEKPSTTNARKNNEWKTTVNKSSPVASPGSPGSSSSTTFSINQRSKRSSSAPRRSSINHEKPSAINARRNNERTTTNKVSPVSTRLSRTPPSQGSSSSTTTTFSVNQRSKRSSSAPRRSSVNNEKPSATVNKVGPVSTHMSRTPSASPGSSESSSSTTFSVNQQSKRSSSAPRRTSVDNEKPLTTNARKNNEFKTTTNNVIPVKNNNTGVSKTLPSSPVSSSPTFSNSQRSKRSNSVPRRSSVNEKPLENTASKSDEWKISKPAVVLIPKTQSSISLKIKPPPVLSHPSLLSESSSSSSTCKVNQKSNLTGQPAASRSETRSPNGSKPGRVLSPKTVAAVNTGLKPISQKTSTTSKPSRKQSSVKAKAKSSSGVSRGAEDIILVSPEVMDIKGKLNALKMEISMQKKMSHDESGKGESSSIIQMNNQTKSKQRMYP